MISIKNESEIRIMQEAGEKLARTLRKIVTEVKPGISTKDLDTLAEKWIKAENSIPSFKGFEGFPGSLCTSVNDGLVHGIPNTKPLKTGDHLSIDIGLIYNGYQSDMATSVIVGDHPDQEKQRFLAVGQQSLEAAISQARVDNHVGDISAAMQKVIEEAGYTVSDIFTGHGIGKKMHEDPYIPCFGVKGKGLKLKENMTIAIEVIYARGKAIAVIERDGWTTHTEDHSWGGLFEHTVWVSKNGPIVLTK